ncbi:MAG: hypothetical protein ACYC6T_18330 [Thermoleophilia bacterium]
MPATEEELREWLVALLEEAREEDRIQVRTLSYQDAGLLTRDEGLVLRFPSGRDFCLTIQRWH